MLLVEFVLDAVVAIFIANDANCRRDGLFRIALIDAVDRMTKRLLAIV